MLAFNAWLIIKRFGEKTGIIKGIQEDIKFILNKKGFSLTLLAPYAAVIISVFIFFPVYWNLTLPAISADLPKGVTSDGHPWIGGGDNPELIITEYSDYLCFQCRKMHFFLRHLVNKNPEKIRLIHRHYPMDDKFNPIVKETFHVGSGDMALFAIYASTKGKFWEMNDYLFSMDKSLKSIDIKELAGKTGLDYRELAMARNDSGIRGALRRDIVDGLKLKITGTPGYVIDKKLYLGEIPADIIKKVVK
jgi:protein-disulfide isomerase